MLLASRTNPAPRGCAAGASRATRPGRRVAASTTRAQAAPPAPPGAADKFIPPWKDCFVDLKAKGLRTVSPQEAAERLATGKWVLLDVRRPDQHDEAAPEGAVNAPMYAKMDMSKPDAAKLLKTIAYAFNGVQAIDSNRAFTADALAAAAGRKIVVVCEAGGSMRQTVNFPLGKPSRSLQAAYKLLNEAPGLTADDVAHLERGVFGWWEADLPMRGDYKPDLGRTPMAAPDPMAASSGGGGEQQPPPEEKKKFFGLF